MKINHVLAFLFVLNLKGGLEETEIISQALLQREKEERLKKQENFELQQKEERKKEVEEDRTQIMDYLKEKEGGFNRYIMNSIIGRKYVHPKIPVMSRNPVNKLIPFIPPIDVNEIKLHNKEQALKDYDELFTSVLKDGYRPFMYTIKSTINYDPEYDSSAFYSNDVEKNSQGNLHGQKN